MRWIFSIITPVFSVTWSFTNHSNIWFAAQEYIIIILFEAWQHLVILYAEKHDQDILQNSSFF